MENPIEVLITEHELIDKLLKILKDRLSEMKETKKIDNQIIDVTVDCFESFINRVHHWKEENILFTELRKKDLTERHRGIISKLTQEHVVARKLINKIVEGKHKYEIGEMSGFDELIENLEKFVAIYVPHLRFENTEFFPEALKYFDDDEKRHLEALFSQVESESVIKNYSLVLENLETK
jgi:hemerythrin-like domain-containing protein